MSGPKRLYLIHQYTREVPVPSGSIVMSSGCYLVQADDGRNIIIDSGVPADVPSPGPATEDSPEILVQLSGLGVEPHDVDTVICTHYDIDHVGRHERFTNAVFVVQREHHELAASGAERFAGGRAHWDPQGVERRLVDGDVELLPGATAHRDERPCTRSSVSARAAPPDRSRIARRGCRQPATPVHSRPARPLSYEDPDRLRVSTRKLLDIAANEDVAFTVFHHDGEQWNTLRRAPEYFD